MSSSILAAAGSGSDRSADDPKTDAATSDTTGASPAVLRELHAAWVRQLRNGALASALVMVCAAVVAAVVGGKSFAQLYLLVGIMAAQTALSAVHWWSARRVDPVAAALHEPAQAELEQARLHAHRARLAERGAHITTALAIIVTAVTVVEWFTAGSIGRTVARAGLVKLLVSDGEWWRLGTSTFVHAGAFHLAANIAALAAFGRVVEAYVARSWLLVTYAVSGIAGGLVSWWWTPAANSVGASGAVMGVVAFAAVLCWRRPAELPAGIRRAAVMALTATAFVGALSFGLIDNGAHAGGAAAGALLALIAVPRHDSRAGAGSRGLAFLGGVCALAILIAAGQAVAALAKGPRPFSRRVTTSSKATPVTSASVAVHRDRTGSVLRITNHSTQALEAYQVMLLTAGALWRDDCCIASDGHGPVPPGGSLELPLEGARPVGRAGIPAAVAVAVFADGTFEGDVRAYERIVARRRQTAEEAAFWLQKIDSTSPLPPADAAVRLSAYGDIRLMATDGWATPLAALGIDQLIRVAREEPTRFAGEAANTKARILDVQAALSVRLSGRK